MQQIAQVIYPSFVIYLHMQELARPGEPFTLQIYYKGIHVMLVNTENFLQSIIDSTSRLVGWTVSYLNMSTIFDRIAISHASSSITTKSNYSSSTMELSFMNSTFIRLFLKLILKRDRANSVGPNLRPLKLIIPKHLVARWEGRFLFPSTRSQNFDQKRHKQSIRLN